MTCIVGIVDKEKKRVVIGGDSAASNGSNIFIRRDEKVFLNGDFVIGCTSSFRMIQLLRFSFKPPEVQGKDIYEYMCTDFIDAVRECFKNGGYLQKAKEGDDKGGHFLVGYKNRLFKVECDFQVAENFNGMDAVGCGADFALGSLCVLSEENTAAEYKVLKALEAAESLAMGVCRPFVIMGTLAAELPTNQKIEIDIACDPNCKSCKGTGIVFTPNFGGGGTTTRCYCSSLLNVNVGTV